MKQALRELKDELQMILMRVIEMETYQREKDAGKVVAPDGFPRRTFTGTYRGSKQGLLSLPDQAE